MGDDFFVFTETPSNPFGDPGVIGATAGQPILVNEDGSIADLISSPAPLDIVLPSRSSDIAVLAALAAAWWVFA